MTYFLFPMGFYLVEKWYHFKTPHAYIQYKATYLPISENLAPEHCPGITTVSISAAHFLDKDRKHFGYFDASPDWLQRVLVILPTVTWLCHEVISVCLMYVMYFHQGWLMQMLYLPLCSLWHTGFLLFLGFGNIDIARYPYTIHIQYVSVTHGFSPIRIIVFCHEFTAVTVVTRDEGLDRHIIQLILWPIITRSPRSAVFSLVLFNGT